MKKIMSKCIIIAILAICVLILGYKGAVYAYNRYNYNKYYTQASELLSAEKYDEAILNFNKALEYDDKSLDKINNQVELAKQLKISKLNYEEGINLLNNKDYLKAIDKFKNVIKDDKKRYDLAKQKIKESSDYYIKENIEKAESLANEKKYSEAIKYLDIILDFDSSNEEAIQLKKEYNDMIKKIEEERLKKLEEERLRKLQEKKKATSTAPYTIKQEGNNLKVIMKDGFTYYVICKYMFNDLSPKSQVFSIAIPEDCTYELTVHYEDKDVTVKGKPTRLVHVMSGKIPEDRKLSCTFKLFSRGKVYTVKKSFGLSSRFL